jgi:hypothetical protein
MARRRIKFNPDIVYFRNLYSNIVGFKVDHELQILGAREIRKKQIYDLLDKPVYRNLEKYKDEKPDIYVLCHDITTLNNALYNLQEHFNNTGNWYLLVPKHLALNIRQKAHCLACSYTNINLLWYDHRKEKKSLPAILKAALLDGPSSYALLIDTDHEIEKNYDLSDAVYWLERTFAHAFYFNNQEIASNKNSTTITHIEDHIYAWKFFLAPTFNTKNIYRIDGMLSHKTSLLKILQSIHAHTLEELKREFSFITDQENKIGLCYQ